MRQDENERDIIHWDLTNINTWARLYASRRYTDPHDITVAELAYINGATRLWDELQRLANE